jgi:hypothetical protein
LVLEHNQLINIKRIAFFASLVVSLAAIGGDIQLSAELKSGVFSLVLGQENGRCKITYSGLKHHGSVLSDIAAPCQVIRDAQQKPLSHTYKDLGNGYARVILITGGPPSQTKKDAYMKGGCGTQVQALVVREDGVSLSKEIGRGSTFCPSAGADEKMFRFLSRQK